MPRLREVRPTSTDVARSGTTLGTPADGRGSLDSWSAYQSGSIQTSATHDSASGGATGSAGAGTGSAAAGAGVSRSSGEGTTGRGIEPVVKS
ncbi:hypothetical protein [Nocardioides convexus]|uniref:hypothetical protein n=1 Tax=Nocardioides convexus TaxID=2712224 RepID=UPI00241893D2|nr:hypothetical protein [Nocardioides convexus]